jgi:hypothetical protein
MAIESSDDTDAEAKGTDGFGNVEVRMDRQPRLTNDNRDQTGIWRSGGRIVIDYIMSLYRYSSTPKVLFFRCWLQ